MKTDFHKVAPDGVLGGQRIPGNAASYKVDVILTTGNERGSNPVTITRPG